MSVFQNFTMKQLFNELAIRGISDDDVEDKATAISLISAYDERRTSTGGRRRSSNDSDNSSGAGGDTTSQRPPAQQHLSPPAGNNPRIARAGSMPPQPTQSSFVARRPDRPPPTPVISESESGSPAAAAPAAAPAVLASPRHLHLKVDGLGNRPRANSANVAVLERKPIFPSLGPRQQPASTTASSGPAAPGPARTPISRLNAVPEARVRSQSLHQASVAQGGGPAAAASAFAAANEYTRIDASKLHPSRIDNYALDSVAEVGTKQHYLATLDSLDSGASTLSLSDYGRLPSALYLDEDEDGDAKDQGKEQRDPAQSSSNQHNAVDSTLGIVAPAPANSSSSSSDQYQSVPGPADRPLLCERCRERRPRVRLMVIAMELWMCRPCADKAIATHKDGLTREALRDDKRQPPASPSLGARARGVINKLASPFSSRRSPRSTRSSESLVISPPLSPR